MSNLDAFRALCIKVADERDPKKIELRKQRMRILLLDGLEASEEVAKPLLSSSPVIEDCVSG